MSTPHELERITRPGSIIVLGARSNESEAWLLTIDRLRQRCQRLFVLVLALESSEEFAIRALRARVDDYLRPPFSSQNVVGCLPRAEGKSDGGAPAASIVGESPSIRALRTQLQRLASLECNVLITGESGTGKELVASDIHRLSARAAHPLICVNCAAVPDTLIESELFGYERGAFTGADMRRDGKFKAADGGVIFLDEVGDLSLYAQAKLLRVVESKEIFRLGSNQPFVVNVRIIAATHRNLEQMVADGRFRQDLFFRLNVGRVQLSPLRDRTDDIPLLLDHYLRLLNPQMRTQVSGFSEDAIDLLRGYDWPGNVRELRNVVEATLIYADYSEISSQELPEHIKTVAKRDSGPDELRQLLGALTAAKWNKSKAAAQLQWSRMTLYRKMAKHSLHSHEEDPPAQKGHCA